MKKLVMAILLLLLTITAGCGDHRNEPQLFTTDILSNQAFDGDIEVSSTTTSITQGADNVFVGIDPVAVSETRGFLDFSLDTIPVNAVIQSATLSIFINNITFLGPTGTIPVQIDLVNYDPQKLLEGNFFQPPILSTSFQPPLNLNDIGKDVAIDITPLMAEAQRQRLSALQLRLRSLTKAAGLVEIDEKTVAPLLTVSYF
ncbi:hypothetical protein [Geotalea sp. SG265]|uniref:hypothetical protein n=1 Tax=Geotalea sp. SG265 TaxID=2922867 RepID=UPI001FAE80A0|nr:hypothetical protein [Geotalea sp. SG265]